MQFFLVHIIYKFIYMRNTGTFWKYKKLPFCCCVLLYVVGEKNNFFLLRSMLVCWCALIHKGNTSYYTAENLYNISRHKMDICTIVHYRWCIVYIYINVYIHCRILLTSLASKLININFIHHHHHHHDAMYVSADWIVHN